MPPIPEYDFFQLKGMLKQKPKGMEVVCMTQPEKKFSAGAVVATVWQNQGTTKDGQAVGYKTVSLQRRYKDKEGNWKNANSFRVSDLPRAALVLQKAFEYSVLKELEGNGSAVKPTDSTVKEEVIM